MSLHSSLRGVVYRLTALDQDASARKARRPRFSRVRRDNTHRARVVPEIPRPQRAPQEEQWQMSFLIVFDQLRQCMKGWADVKIYAPQPSAQPSGALPNDRIVQVPFFLDFASSSHMTLTEPQVGVPSCPPEDQERTMRATTRQRCNPLELAEILFKLGEYLPRKVVADCLRVCQKWHRELLPWVWSSIEIKETRCLPSLSALETHASLVRKLYLSNNDCVALWNSIHFPGLTALVVTIPGSKEEISELIRRHQSTLLVLHVHYSLTPELLDAVLGCQRLEDLRIFEVAIDVSQWIIIYQRLLHRLKVLTLITPESMTEKAGDGVDVVHGFNGMDPALVCESASVGTLQNLTLGGEDLWTHFKILKKCPDLIQLDWLSPTASLDHTPMRLLAQELQDGTAWDRLESLTLQQPFSNTNFITLIDRLPGLMELDLSRSNFDRQSWHLLKGSALANRLRSLTLIKCRSLHGTVLQDILCTLTALSILRADVISDTHLEKDSRPWVCLGLKEMRLCFSPVSRSYEDVIALRLSQLTELKVLDLDYSGLSLYLSIDGSEDDYGILDRLRTLRNMTSFSMLLLGGVTWDNTELEWVQEHWPKLRWLEVQCVGRPGRNLLE